ncbi:hypothetical protein GCM10012287_46600 [Streptomyces daqingensis]|uniref:Uncharacterized protein n=1 Tax=Streptomyces daqingensis TaxID=1472640 RepID=A0ABQ2MN62_9ACTN|nr:plasmid transfer protein TraA [Streptomyces daqingensis]GGO55405.1 hypothetical protein GCM10012287_46600 [Streptomyces daqingensis]
MASQNLRNAAPDVPYIGGKAKTTPPPHAVPPSQRHINKSNSLNPALNGSININITKNGGGSAPKKSGQEGMPGGDFLSNEDIRAFCEYGRKAARQRAVERALDAEMLEGRLRNIPDTTGSMAGARSRARRVTRWLKRIAQAEKLMAKWYSALYSAFEREYEAELMKIGKARPQQKQHSHFGWR